MGVGTRMSEQGKLRPQRYAQLRRRRSNSSLPSRRLTGHHTELLLRQRSHTRRQSRRLLACRSYSERTTTLTASGSSRARRAASGARRAAAGAAAVELTEAETAFLKVPCGVRATGQIRSIALYLPLRTWAIVLTRRRHLYWQAKYELLQSLAASVPITQRFLPQT